MDPILQPVSDKLDAQNQTINDLNNQVAADNIKILDAATAIATLNVKLNLALNPGLDFLDLQKQNWVEEPYVGNTGSAVGGHGSFTTTINDDGSRRFNITPGVGPDGKGYDNFFWGAHGLFIPKIGQVTHLTDIIKFRIVGGDISLSQGIEWENQRNMNLREANFAFCVNPHDKRWAYFDKINRKWIAASIPYDPTVFSDWVTVTLDCTLDEDAGTKTHNWVEINLKHYALNYTQALNPKTPENSRWDCNFQMDSTGIHAGAKLPPPYSVDFFRNVHVEFANWRR